MILRVFARGVAIAVVIVATVILVDGDRGGGGRVDLEAALLERLGLALENLDLAVGELGVVFEIVEERGGILPALIAFVAQLEGDGE